MSDKDNQMTKETIGYKNIAAGISAFMLFLAIAKLPYGYYILLRWVVTISALFSAWVAYNSEDKFWPFLMGGIAILFNPIIPVYLTKEIWVVIDFIIAIVFLISILTGKSKSKPTVRKCPYCGKILTKDAIFCPQCGRKLKEEKT